MVEAKFHISISDDESVNIQSAEDALNFVKGFK
jgi:acyl carrier protein